MEYTNLSDALRLQLLTSIDKNTLSTLKKEVYGFSHRSPLEIFSHINNKYNRLTTRDISRNYTKIKEPFDTSTEIVIVFKGIEDCVKLFKEHSLYTNIRILITAYDIIYNTGIFQE